MECVLVRSPSEVCIVTPSELFFGPCFEVGVDVLGIMPGVFAHVICWCVPGDVRIWDGSFRLYKF